MAAPTAERDTGVSRHQLGARYVRWGGLAAILGPLLVLSANMYGIWESQMYGSGPDGILAAATTTPHMVFGGVRLLGGMVLVFGLIALYAAQVDAAGRLGVLGFVVSMIGTVLLTGQAWFLAFFEPALATEAPSFIEAAMTGEAGLLLSIGLFIPLTVQAIGWVIFGIATYRANIFPRRAAIILIIGAFLLFVPVQGSPTLFQLAIAWLGYLLYTNKIDVSPTAKPSSQL